MLRKSVVFTLLVLALCGCKSSLDCGSVSIIPEPLNVVVGDDVVRISSVTYNTNDSILESLADEFTSRASMPPDGVGKQVVISVSDTMKNPEGYHLVANGDGVSIIGGSYAGVYYGLRTLGQLVQNGNVPYVDIVDEPRFAWRGTMLDVARHFQPKENIKEFIDILAMHKINKFHWHLTDGIGWRIEIDQYPELTAHGAWRKDKHPEAPWVDMELSQEGADSAYGGFYTKSDIREIVDYAKSRFIEIIPEIEMPGHSMAAIMCYPELTCPNVKGHSDVYCAGNDKTFEYLFGVLDEVAELFPSEYIHIGGDEVGKEQWAACPLCQKRKRTEGLKDEHELQSYFIKRISDHLASRGKKLIGWDEIIEGGLAQNATVMSWTGWEGGIKAAKSKHNVVMCPLDYVYLDHYQGYNPFEPQAWGSYNGIKRVYDFPVIPEGLADEYKKYVIGGQGNLWTENITTWDHVRYMLLPRMAALSESLWSAPDNKNWDRFEHKLDRQLDRYKQYGWNYSESAMTPMVKSVELLPNGNVKVKLYAEFGQIKIHFTTDGSEPTLESSLYDSVIVIDAPTTLKASGFDKHDRKVGYMLTIEGLKNIATGAKVKYDVPFNDSYSGGGDKALTDNRFAIKRGDDKAWQGFEKQNMDFTVDLGQTKEVSSVSLRFFQHKGSTSVMLPLEVEVELSENGEQFKSVAKESVAPETTYDALVKPVTLKFQTQKAKYVRVKAVNMGALPDAHPRKGANAWVFTDEIIVN